MQYKNATQAALEIGISYRTMRRRIESGQIKAVRGEDGQYSIAQSEVERLKQVQSERPKPAMGGHVETGHGQPDLEQRVADLEQRMRTLEDMAARDHMLPAPSSQDSPQPQKRLHRFQVDADEAMQEHAATDHQKRPVSSTTTETIPTTRKPLTATTDANIDGMLSASDFAAQLDISYDDMKNYMRRGINGERMDLTEIKHPTRANYTNKFFNPEQQEAAIEMLKRHGKLS
jgi:hypothetical protein